MDPGKKFDRSLKVVDRSGPASAISLAGSLSTQRCGREHTRLFVSNYTSVAHDGRASEFRALTNADSQSGPSLQAYEFALSCKEALQGCYRLSISGQASSTGAAFAEIEVDLPSGMRRFTWRAGQPSVCIRLQEQRLGIAGLRVRIRTHASVHLATRGFGHAYVQVSLQFAQEPQD